MTAQTFQSVFRKISLSASVQEAFRESIVQKLAIHKKEHMVSMKISASRLIPLDKWDALREELLRNLPGIHSVEVAAVYNLPEDAPEFGILFDSFPQKKARSALGSLLTQSGRFRTEKC